MNSTDLAAQNRFLVLVNGQSRGPFDIVELAAEWRYGNIGPDTSIQREGDDTWVPFQTCPEFATAQAVPLEIIARHLEKKERAAGTSARSSAQSLPVIILAFIVIVAAAGVAYSVLTAPPEKTADAAVQTTPPVPDSPAPWLNSNTSAFSVTCPVPLQIIEPKYHGAASYRGYYLSSEVFGIDFAVIPENLPDQSYDAALQELKSRFLDEMGATETSHTTVTLNGYQGYDILFTFMKNEKPFLGGLRLLGGRERIAVAWVTARSTPEASKDINRYLSSFTLN